MKKILITGATGYIGGRLIPRLIDHGYEVRCMARDTSRISGRWEGAEIVYGDVTKFPTIREALKDIEIAYYLIHSMSAGEKKFEDLDKKAAENFARKAEEAGVKRIIYLGGLGDRQDNLSPHLTNRQITGEMLRSTSVPVTEFRAGMIVGSGSISFEMVRYLTERVPIMICPKWVRTKTQPIAIRDVLKYLISALEISGSIGKVIEIGGNDILTYEELMRIYARIRGLKRIMIDVPLLTPRLSSYWVDLVTPIPSSIARPLIEGLKNELIVKKKEEAGRFDIETIDYEHAVRLALEREKYGRVETIWSGAISSIIGREAVEHNLQQKEGMIIERRERITEIKADILFKAVLKIGGRNGWYANWLWRIRGFLDRLVGGVGMRRGRRDPNNLVVGDPLDFWRVEAIERKRMLRLRAEMKLPGKAWLQYNIEEISPKKSAIIQSAFFEPRGLSGIIYWYSIYFIHKIIFDGMIDRIVKLGEREEGEKS